MWKRLVNFDLEDLDNLPNGVSGAIGNILFNGQTEIQDSFDVANANQNLERFSTRTQSRSSMTWITTPRAGMTLMMSSMVRNDTLTGLSGDDILQGGAGKDILTGGMDQFWITSNALPKEADTITDFQVGIDAIGIWVCMG